MRLRVQWRTLAVSCVLATAAASVGCGSNCTAPTTPTPNAVPADGYWYGRTSEQEGVTVGIANNTVVEFTTHTWVRGTHGECGLYLVNAAPVPIQNGAVTIPVGLQPRYVVTLTVTVTGSFSSATSMSGTIAAISVPAGFCDSAAPAYEKEAITFTAVQ
jgi:hypothetical protein